MGKSGINKESDVVADIQIGPTDKGMVRIFVSSEKIEIPMDFSPEEAINIANDTSYGLSSMVSCGDPKKGQQIAKQIRAGQVIVNRISRGDYPAPFGGFKMSGNGREHGTFGIDEYLEVQAVIT